MITRGRADCPGFSPTASTQLRLNLDPMTGRGGFVHVHGGTITLNYTGEAQTFVVPDGVCEITVDAFGARGGAGGIFEFFDGGAGLTAEYGSGEGDVGAEQFASGFGLGGRATSTLTVTPGESLTVMVGGHGRSPFIFPFGGAGGFNGGGDGGAGEGVGGGGGGGASDVRQGGSALSNRVVVAGGGGGGGAGGPGGDGADAGDGGGTVGDDGDDGAGDPVTEQGTGGGGGTDTTGGTAGTNATDDGGGTPPTAGDLGVGGTGGSHGDGGGGGGGGYYGGGGAGAGFVGSGGGGGGGSGFGPAGTAFDTGVNAGDGRVLITWDPAVQPAGCPSAVVVRFAG